jgi:hypothetical protein
LKAAQVQNATQSQPLEDFGWAEAPTVQVPPAPVSLPGAIAADERGPMILDASDGQQQSASAYLPTDLLRVLRPRVGQG